MDLTKIVNKNTLTVVFVGQLLSSICIEAYNGHELKEHTHTESGPQIQQHFDGMIEESGGAIASGEINFRNFSNFNV